MLVLPLVTVTQERVEEPFFNILIQLWHLRTLTLSAICRPESTLCVMFTIGVTGPADWLFTSGPGGSSIGGEETQFFCKKFLSIPKKYVVTTIDSALKKFNMEEREFVAIFSVVLVLQGSNKREFIRKSV
jgi:hypothetical protein